MKKVSIIIAFILLVIVSIILIYSLIIAAIFYRDVGFKYKEYEAELNLPYETECYKSKWQIRQELNTLLGTSFYIYEECNMGTYGLMSPIIRKIKIQKDMDAVNYTYTLAHELVHLSQCVQNERYTTYTAIVKLYESIYSLNDFEDDLDAIKRKAIRLQNIVDRLKELENE